MSSDLDVTTETGLDVFLFWFLVKRTREPRVTSKRVSRILKQVLVKSKIGLDPMIKGLPGTQPP